MVDLMTSRAEVSLKRYFLRLSSRATDTPRAARDERTRPRKKHHVGGKTRLNVTVWSLLAIFLLGTAPRVHAETLALEGNETLFYVMTAINAAGYDEGVNLPDNDPLRKQVRDYLATRKISVLPDLKTYYRRHMQK